MEIRNKTVFRIEVRNKIDKFVRHFPYDFFGNILLNLVVFTVIIIFGLFGYISAYSHSDGNYTIMNNPRYGFLGWVLYATIGVAVFYKVLQATVGGFLNNVKILRNIRAGHYDFDIKDHEMDNAIELIEDLPKKSEEMEMLRTSLSFNKIIDVLESSRIIQKEKNVYDMNIYFRYQLENDALTNQEADSIRKK